MAQQDQLNQAGNATVRRRFRPSPPQVITLSFAAMILVGAGLLCLPFASQDGQSVGFLNALFTAASANCVTGLIVHNTLAQWSLFGKAVILALIQLGGLGLMVVLTVAMVLLRQRVSLTNRLIIQASYNLDSIGGMVRLVRRVVGITLSVEAIGATLLTLGFWHAARVPFFEALGLGIFHSISAFCNAGFDVIGAESLTPFAGHWAINLAIMALIVSGGLGFTVWVELIDIFRRKRRPARLEWIHLSLHSKMALLGTVIMIALGFGLFLALEWRNPQTLGPMQPAQKGLAALFQSVTLRTAGFNTIDQAGMSDVSKVISCIMMLIGGAPAGTAGGIKVVTLGIIAFAVISVLRGNDVITAFGRTLPLSLLLKALTVACAMLAGAAIATMALYFTEQNSAFAHNIIDLAFEVSSAIGTVGVTTGITPHLSPIGKGIIILCMFIGRISPITLVVALNMRLHSNPGSIAYPEERVIIG